jgi:hypothetical protein
VVPEGLNALMGGVKISPDQVHKAMLITLISQVLPPSSESDWSK